MSDQPVHFEQSLEQLQKTIEALEKGNLPLDEAMQQFQHAVTLSKACQKALQDAELKISQMTQDGKLLEVPEISIDDSQITE